MSHLFLGNTGLLTCIFTDNIATDCTRHICNNFCKTHCSVAKCGSCVLHYEAILGLCKDLKDPCRDLAGT